MSPNRWHRLNPARLLVSVRAYWRLHAPTINMNAVWGLCGLAMVFGGVAVVSLPAACLLTGLLIYRDATHPSAPDDDGNDDKAR